ncbi:hypothetical protein DXG01_004724 [Tephrocybe rancida]|nr:hypothetical protein DXG01_004724 [Tephrocybe rancida]
MEIGSPMASMYLLGNPGHYTSQDFVPFYWRNYVAEVQRAYEEKEEEMNRDEVADVKQENLGLTDVKIEDAQKDLLDTTVSDMSDKLSSVKSIKSEDTLSGVDLIEGNSRSGSESIEHEDKIDTGKVNSNLQADTSKEKKINIKPDPAGLNAIHGTKKGDGSSVEYEKNSELSLADKDARAIAEDKPSVKLGLSDAPAGLGIEDPSGNKIDKTFTSTETSEKVVIRKYKGTYSGASIVDDYKHRPSEFETCSLYKWIQISKQVPSTKRAREKIETEVLESASKDDSLGRKTLWARAQMNEAEDIMVQSGWLDKALDGFHKLDVTRYISQAVLGTSAWKQTVKTH